MKRISIETRNSIVQKWCSEKWPVRKLAKLFKCSKSAVFQIINKFGNHYKLEGLPKSRRRKGPADPKTEENVVKHLTSEKCMSVREIAK